MQATATEGLGPRESHASPLWTLQRLCFEPDVAADFSDRGENRDNRNSKIRLTKEMRLENAPFQAKAGGPLWRQSSPFVSAASSGGKAPRAVQQGDRERGYLRPDLPN